jgi:hypothetical protein
MLKKFISGGYGLMINFWIAFICLFVVFSVFLDLSMIVIWVLLIPSSIAVWRSDIDSCRIGVIEIYRFTSRSIIFIYWAIVLFTYFGN